MHFIIYIKSFFFFNLYKWIISNINAIISYDKNGYNIVHIYNIYRMISWKKHCAISIWHDYDTIIFLYIYSLCTWFMYINKFDCILVLFIYIFINKNILIWTLCCCYIITLHKRKKSWWKQKKNVKNLLDYWFEYQWFKCKNIHIHTHLNWINVNWVICIISKYYKKREFKHSIMYGIYFTIYSKN